MANCPGCGMGLEINANLMAEETITVRLGYTEDWLDVATVWEVLKAVEHCVVETARCRGATKTAVMCSHLSIGKGEFAADILVMCKDGDAMPTDIDAAIDAAMKG